MNFGQPIWLLIGAAACVFLGWLFRRFEENRLEALRHFAAGHLLEQLTASVSKQRRILKKTCLLLAAAFFFIALARPQWGFHWEEAKRKGIDVLFAVDVSRSMLARDVNPDRLTRAKLAVADLLEKMDGDRVGLIAFRGSAFLESPFTLDYDAFRQSLEALDMNIIPQPGTDIASAIREAESVFGMGSPNHKILILITDGEDLEGNALTAAKEAAKQGVKIFTVGVGTPAGEIIPVVNENGGTEFVKDSNGQVVKSRLDESTLHQIAESTGGFYEPLGQRGEGLNEIYNQGLSSIPKQELVSRMKKSFIERFQWPLGIAIFLLALEMLVGNRKRGRNPPRKGGRQGAGNRTANQKLIEGQNNSPLTAHCLVHRSPALRDEGRSLVISSFFLISSLIPHLFSPLYASPQSAEKSYHQGKFHAAYEEYQLAVKKNPEKAELNYNMGTAAYRDGDFPGAANAFEKALQTPHLNLQQQAFYNLGNAQYRQGEPTEKTNPRQTLQLWRQALQAYEGALKLKKEDADAKFNYEFVKKKLKELEKNQPKDQSGNENKENDQQNAPQNQNPPKKDSQDKGQNKNSDSKDQSQEQKKDSQNGGRNNSGENQGSQKKEEGGDRNGDENKQNQPGSENAGNPSKNQSNENSNFGDNSKKTKKQEEMEANTAPGQMTPREAKALLDSLKGDEKKFPLLQAGQGKSRGNVKENDKDW